MGETKDGARARSLPPGRRSQITSTGAIRLPGRGYAQQMTADRFPDAGLVAAVAPGDVSGISEDRRLMRPVRPLWHIVGLLSESVRAGVTRATLSMFEHAPYPLEHTLDHAGDPGLMGPDSMSWRLIADPAAFVGGLRALLIQAAHPEVVAGVDQHSRYQDDPFGRLSRTSAYVTATTFGARPEVEEAVRQVRRAHAHVTGVSSRGIRYDAADPSQSAWVHNALTDSFLTTNQRFSSYPLTVVETDRFVEEQNRIGRLLGADPLPASAPALRDWVRNHADIAPSPEMGKVVDFLSDPPLSAGIKAGYSLMFEAAVVTLPERLRQILGLEPTQRADLLGRAAVKGLRWALGYSPSWALALGRTGRDIPPGLFRRIPKMVLERAPQEVSPRISE